MAMGHDPKKNLEPRCGNPTNHIFPALHGIKCEVVNMTPLNCQMYPNATMRKQKYTKIRIQSVVPLQSFSQVTEVKKKHATTGDCYLPRPNPGKP